MKRSVPLSFYMSSLFNNLGGIKESKYRKERSLVGLAKIRFCDLIDTKL
jgi:hypothetical protein